MPGVSTRFSTPSPSGSGGTALPRGSVNWRSMPRAMLSLSVINAGWPMWPPRPAATRSRIWPSPAPCLTGRSGRWQPRVIRPWCPPTPIPGAGGSRPERSSWRGGPALRSGRGCSSNSCGTPDSTASCSRPATGLPGRSAPGSPPYSVGTMPISSIPGMGCRFPARGATGWPRPGRRRAIQRSSPPCPSPIGPIPSRPPTSSASPFLFRPRPGACRGGCTSSIDNSPAPAALIWPSMPRRWRHGPSPPCRALPPTPRTPIRRRPVRSSGGRAGCGSFPGRRLPADARFARRSMPRSGRSWRSWGWRSSRPTPTARRGRSAHSTPLGCASFAASSMAPMGRRWPTSRPVPEMR